MDQFEKEKFISDLKKVIDENYRKNPDACFVLLKEVSPVDQRGHAAIYGLSSISTPIANFYLEQNKLEEAHQVFEWQFKQNTLSEPARQSYMDMKPFIEECKKQDRWDLVYSARVHQKVAYHEHADIGLVADLRDTAVNLYEQGLLKEAVHLRSLQWDVIRGLRITKNKNTEYYAEEDSIELEKLAIKLESKKEYKAALQTRRYQANALYDNPAERNRLAQDVYSLVKTFREKMEYKKLSDALDLQIDCFDKNNPSYKLAKFEQEQLAISISSSRYSYDPHVILNYFKEGLNINAKPANGSNEEYSIS